LGQFWPKGRKGNWATHGPKKERKVAGGHLAHLGSFLPFLFLFLFLFSLLFTYSLSIEQITKINPLGELHSTFRLRHNIQHIFVHIVELSVRIASRF
jgi:hypothetical protein